MPRHAAPIAALALALAAAPLAAQQSGSGATGDATAATPQPDAMQGVTRTWAIYLKSGAVIEFDARFDWAGQRGPAQFLSDYEKFVVGGSAPAIARYNFPRESGQTIKAAEIVIDFREVAAVVQLF